MATQKKPSSPIQVSIHNVGSLGVVQDVPGHELPPEAWTSVRNIRFHKNNAERISGHIQVFGTPEVTPYFNFHVPGPAEQSFWFYFSLEKAYVVESGVHSEVTNTGGDYNTDEGRDWNGTLFGGVPIFNNGEDPPQWWPDLNPGTELEDLPDWPADTTAKVIRAFGSYLFALNITEGAVQKANAVLVSHKADPGSVPSSWDYTDDTVDAILFELIDDIGGELLDGRALGSSFIAYKKNSTHIIRFIGGTELWGRDLLLADTGVLATRCVCAFAKGTKHFVVTDNDILVHSGTKDAVSIVEGKNKETIFTELDSVNYRNAYCVNNVKRNEVWFCYPTSGHEFPDKVFIWNYVNNTQTFRDLNSLSAAFGPVADTSLETWDSDSDTWDSDTETWETAGLQGLVVASPEDEVLYQLDSGAAFGDSAPVVFLERVGLAVIGKDRQGQPKVDFGVRKLVTRIWPKCTGLGVWTIRLGAAESRDGAITWSDPVSFDPSTQQYVDIVVNGRLISVQFSSNESVSSTLEGYDLEMALLGKH